MGTFGTPSSYNNTGALGSATNPTTAQGLSRDRENQKAILELPGTQAWVEKTITDGVIIPTSAEIIVLPEGGASTDSLTTIALTSDGTTTLHEGMLIRLKAANSNTITVVHGTGTNNISTIDGNNVVLDTTWYLELKLINGLWVQQETSAYITANEAKITAAAAASTPATTTSRGIGRVATSADLAEGATINNGPAFLAAGDVVSVAAAAGKVPVADTNGKIDAWISQQTQYAACATAAATAAKVADLADFRLVKGARVFVSFTNQNTVAGSLTLNINSTGAKGIYNERGAVSSTNAATWTTGIPIEFVYDGNYWQYKTVDAVGNAIGLYLYVRDEKSSGTHGGSTSAATWHTRDLNTVKVNNIGATLSNNRVTLQPGKYYIRAQAPSLLCGGARAALYNVTAGSYISYGTTTYHNDTVAALTWSMVEDEITVSVTTTIELRMYARLASPTGLGYVTAPISGVNEVYSELRIWKM